MYRIRFHGRGGQGIKTAGRILGSAFFRSGFVVQDSPRYGAERRGAPIFSSVRASHHPILERSDVKNPDLIAVSDDTLFQVSAAAVLAGATQNTILLINTRESSEVWAHRLAFPGTVIALPVPSDTPAAAAVCAGAAARLCGSIPEEALSGAMEDESASFSTGSRDRSIEHTLAAYDALGPSSGIVTEGAEPTPVGAPPEWIELEAEGPPLGVPDIFHGATSVEVRTGLWRTVRPVIHVEKCHGCWWICSTLCPDSAMPVVESRPTIDYNHCKGCMICSTVCPNHAIEVIQEKEAAP